jgi:branched-chain amino acid transport system ATP-binding protein
MVLLKLEGVSKRFGGLLAVDRVDLEVDRGEFLGIVGPNGSGKTTLYNLINGVYMPDEGRIFFEGRDITKMPSYKRAHLGLARSFQVPRPFGAATVRENAAIGAFFGSRIGRIGEREALEIADHYLSIFGLDDKRFKVSASLTPVEKKYMEIARALALKPKLLLLDEAMAGMNPRDIDDTLEKLKEIALQEDIAVLAMVEHIMRAVVNLAHRVVVMHQGKKLIDAPTREALSDQRVIDVYLGRGAREGKDAQS